MFTRLAYFFSKALLSLWESFGISLLTATTIGAALTVLASYAMAVQNMEGLALVWGRSSNLHVTISDATKQTEWQIIASEIGTYAGVQTATLITPAVALKAFKARGPEAAKLVEGVLPEVFPAALDIDLQTGFANLKSLEKVAQKILEHKHINEVDYGQAEFKRLQDLLRLLRIAGILAGVFVAFATAFIVANTIRLTLFARREEVQILRLVGATNSFIKTPVILEGALWGLMGGGMAVTALLLGDHFLAPILSASAANVLGGLEIRLFDPQVALATVLVGISLGVGGSMLAVRKFLLQSGA